VLTANGNNVGQAVYSITPEVNGCPGTPVNVIVSVNPIPTVTATATSQTVCSGTATNIVLRGSLPNTTFTWTVFQTGVYGASAGSGSVIAQTLSTVTLVPGTVDYIITPHTNGCTGTPITVTITVNPIPEVFGSPSNTIICSGEAAEFILTPNIPGTTFTWTVVQNGVSGASDGSGTTNPVTVSQVLQTTGNVAGTATYTILPTANGCTGNPITITYRVNPLPNPQIQSGYICMDQVTGSVISTHLLDTGLNNAGYDFVWFLEGVEITGATNSTYTATASGVYSVIATNVVTGCVSEPFEATVTESYAAQVLNLYVSEAFSNNPTITAVVVGGSGNFEYQLDGGAYQTSNVFTGIVPGLHEVHVRDLNGCTDVTQSIFVIGYPHYFTPNGDGYNDTWNIWDLQTQPDAEILIYDRYGKLIKQISPAGEGWDGTYNGQPLPSTDYWFSVKFKDGVNQQERVFKAHFSMKR
jgi:gliding motility-associated-like protein